MKNKEIKKHLLLTKIMIVGTIILFLAIFTQKKRIENYFSKFIQHKTLNSMTLSASTTILEQYNYHDNGQEYRITFLEFGAKGCVSCKKMETVMEEIENKYHQEVNVVFYNVRTEEGSKYASYLGVLTIPVQILLDREGKEFLRHTGYFSTKELTKEITKYGIEN